MEASVGRMRLDKFLAANTGCTRSQIKKILKQGRVSVNGVPCKAGDQKIDPEQDRVALDGSIVAYEPFICLMLNKPAGYVTATEDRRQRTVLDLIEHPRKSELFPVGRLDLDTEGLLLLMNDGELAHRMLSPRHHVDKIYFVRVSGRVTQEDADAFARGVDIGEKSLTLPADMKILSVSEDEEPVSEVLLTIREGKFHQVKRMFAVRQKPVLYLKRAAMAGLTLDETLAPGEYRELTKEEMEKIRNDL